MAFGFYRKPSEDFVPDDFRARVDREARKCYNDNLRDNSTDGNCRAYRIKPLYTFSEN